MATVVFTRLKSLPACTQTKPLLSPRGALIKAIDWRGVLMLLYSPFFSTTNLVFQGRRNYAMVRRQLATAFSQIHNQHVLSQRQLLKASKLPPTLTQTAVMYVHYILWAYVTRRNLSHSSVHSSNMDLSTALQSEISKQRIYQLFMMDRLLGQGSPAFFTLWEFETE